MSCPAAGHPDPDCSVCLCPGDHVEGQVVEGTGPKEPIEGVLVSIQTSPPFLVDTTGNSGEITPLADTKDNSMK